MLYNSNSLDFAHYFIEENVRPGDIIVDATAGNGLDTLFLCHLVGETGRVFAFDIQPQAIEATKQRLEEVGMADRATLILDSHANIDAYVPRGEISAVVFNFGYLPGGDHSIGTRAESSIMAIEKSLSSLKSHGIVSLCIYYGGDSGFEEKDALLNYLKTVDHKTYTVLLQEFFNRPNCPPIVVNIQKNK